MPELNSLNGVFLAPDEDQLRRIWEACTREGVSVDSKGVLELLMMAVEDSEDGTLGGEAEPEVVADPLLNAFAYLQENPEKVAVAAKAGMDALGKMFAGFRKGK